MQRQQRVRRFERVGWYALVLIVLLALAGWFANGPLSDARVASEDGRVQVEYQNRTSGISGRPARERLHIDRRGDELGALTRRTPTHIGKPATLGPRPADLLDLVLTK